MKPGDKLGPYEILAPLGAGGMGEVYRGRDTKLNREVAVKVLPAALARDPERLARFEREAKVLASLNHPNIAQIFGVQEADGFQALVMELVPGQTLGAKIAASRLGVPPEEALQVAAQICDALSAAHEKGITHRDLKPANVMITPEGVVKVLDFGLAAVAPSSNRGSHDVTTSPTLTMSPTSAGMILGTAAYMSPEQARGQVADRRSDIWAFGTLLYEMLTGQRPFNGDTVSDILASVLKDEPDLERAPERLRPLLKRCLAKDPKRRLQAIGDWDLLLDREAGSQSAHGQPVVWIAAAGVMTVVACALGFVSYRHVGEEPPRVLKMSVLPPEKAMFQANSIPAVSPDGRRIAFVASFDGKDQLWVRELDSLAARALTGTDDASYPFWSPDGRTIAFFADGKLKRIEVAGGPALTLCNALNGRGGTWSKNDVIVFAVNGGGTFRVPALGGSATPLTVPDRALGGDNRFPWFLPDGRHFLYTESDQDQEKFRIYIGDAAPEGAFKIGRPIMYAASNAVYAPPGYLLFVRERTLMAQPFDAGRLQTTGDAIPIAEPVDALSGRAAQNQFSISENGVLAYASGSNVAGGIVGRIQLTWFDRSGKVTGTLGTPGTLNVGAISPDGKTAAVDRRDPQTGIYDIWLHDLEHGTASRFTFGPTHNEFPVWSPDGARIAFYSTRDGVGTIFQKATSGAGQDEMVSKPFGVPPTSTRVDDWSRDGRYFIVGRINDPKTRGDVWVLPDRPGDRKAFPFLQTESNEQYAKLSPDGRWLAYRSDESKRNEIYVQSFPTPGGKWQVSTNGGDRPIWSRDGKELYFASQDGKMMAVEVKSGSKSDARFEASVPKPLFDVRFAGGTTWYDIGKDGRFLIPVVLEQTASTPLAVVINWQAALKK